MKHKIFLVDYDSYVKYITENESNKLHRWSSIHNPKSLPSELNLSEIFDNPEPFKIKPPIIYHSNIKDEKNYEYHFTTKMGNEYRVDFIKLQEESPKDKFF
jgi:hypothetical protein